MTNSVMTGMFGFPFCLTPEFFAQNRVINFIFNDLLISNKYNCSKKKQTFGSASLTMVKALDKIVELDTFNHICKRDACVGKVSINTTLQID